jgi:hypothetical protein
MGGTFGGAIDLRSLNHQWRLIMLEYISKIYKFVYYQRSDSIRPFKFLIKILNSLKNNLHLN